MVGRKGMPYDSWLSIGGECDKGQDTRTRYRSVPGRSGPLKDSDWSFVHQITKAHMYNDNIYIYIFIYPNQKYLKLNTVYQHLLQFPHLNLTNPYSSSTALTWDPAMVNRVLCVSGSLSWHLAVWRACTKSAELWWRCGTNWCAQTCRVVEFRL